MEKIKQLLAERFNIIGDKTHFIDYSPQWESFYYCTRKDVIEHIPMSKLISKEFWFIEWLINEKKVDLNKLPIRIECYNQGEKPPFLVVLDDIEILLMMLSIQEKPLEFLESILSD